MLLKYLSQETSFFGLLPIAIPFRKALDSPVLVVPRYGLKTQWLRTCPISYHDKEVDWIGTEAMDNGTKHTYEIPVINDI